MTSMVMGSKSSTLAIGDARRKSDCRFAINAIFHPYMGPCRRSRRTGSGDVMAAEIRLFPCLTDNFGYLIHDPATKATASVDAPEAAPIIKVLEREGWNLTDILITHHHH